LLEPAPGKDEQGNKIIEEAQNLWKLDNVTALRRLEET